ncbi:hypothetical protein B0H11DRAFT_2197221 [Mycena galericulata]|nr:hypothetical protein B0H11DRAFT_2197221 [Mycena galericulata]
MYYYLPELIDVIEPWCIACRPSPESLNGNSLVDTIDRCPDAQENDITLRKDETTSTMFSKILGLYFSLPSKSAALLVRVPSLAQPFEIKSGVSIHNKAFGGQLVAFTRDEPIRVLRNNTVPTMADLGKWEVRQAAPARYSIFNVGFETAFQATSCSRLSKPVKFVSSRPRHCRPRERGMGVQAVRAVNADGPVTLCTFFEKRLDA